MTMLKTRHMLRAVAVTVAALLVSGCAISEGDEWNPGNPAESLPAPTVTVQERTIVSVLTVDAQVVARPGYTLLMPQRDTFRVSSIKGNTAVSAATVLGRAGVAEFTAPLAAVYNGPLLPDATIANSGTPAISLTHPGFGVVAQIPVERAFQYYSQPATARTQIDSGPGIVDCIPAAPASGAADSSGGIARLQVLCLIDDQPGLLDGQQAILALETGRADDVLALPVSAVRGKSGSGQVALIRDGETTIVTVQLGISDGLFIEIASGLNNGDTVLMHGPRLDSNLTGH